MNSGSNEKIRKYKIVVDLDTELKPICVEAMSAADALNEAADIAFSKNYKSLFLSLYNFNEFLKLTENNRIMYLGKYGMPVLKEKIKSIDLIEECF